MTYGLGLFKIMLRQLEKKLVYRRMQRKSASFRRIEIQTATYTAIQKLIRKDPPAGMTSLTGLAVLIGKNIWGLLKKEIKKNKKLCGAKNRYFFEHVLKLRVKKTHWYFMARV